MFINVDLPEPLEPMMATNSPGKISQRDASHGMNVHFARVIGLVDFVELDDGIHGPFSNCPVIQMRFANKIPVRV